jgi:methyl-accepting chemotaxis protein
MSEHANRYPWPRRILHWTLAALVVAQLSVLALFRSMESLAFGRSILNIHFNVGVAILAVALIEICIVASGRWRAPPPPRSSPLWQRLIARTTHVLMLALLVAMPVVGLFTAWARGNAVPLLFVFPLAPPFETDIDVADRLLVVHGGIGMALVALLCFHLGATAFNWFARGENLLTRMAPAQDLGRFRNRVPIWAQLMSAFAALLAICVFVGFDSLRHTREISHIAADTYDHSFLSLSHARAAQADVKELIGVLAAPRRDDVHVADLATSAVSELQVVVARSPDEESRRQAQVLIGRLAGNLSPVALGEIDASLDDVVLTLTGKSFEARTAINTVAANTHDLILLAFAPLFALAALAALAVWINVSNSVTRLRRTLRAIVTSDANAEIRVEGRGELAELMRDVLACRDFFAAQRAEMARLALRQEGDRREAEIQAQLDVLIGTVVAAARAGDFSRRAPEGAELGRFQGIALALNAVCASAETFLDEVELHAARLAKGDLAHRIETPMQGRFARVSMDLNRAASALAGAIGDAAVAGQLTRERASAIHTDARDLTLRSQRQAASLVQTRSAVEQMTTSVRRNVDHAETAARSAQEASARANAGGKLAADAVRAVEQIDKSSRRVAEILGLIKEIATQTNRLALNAAIEAARAGEFGKGFAAVANEVRILAQRSTQSATEIKELLDESQTQVAAGVELVCAAGGALEDIITSARHAAAEIDSILISSREQARVAGHISSSVGEMDQMTQQSTQSAQRTLSAVRELAEGADQLAALVAAFQTDDSEVGPQLRSA